MLKVQLIHVKWATDIGLSGGFGNTKTSLNTWPGMCQLTKGWLLSVKCLGTEPSLFEESIWPHV